MNTTKSQLEELIIEILSHREYSVKRLPNGLQITKGENVYVIDAASQVSSTTSIKFR